MDVTPLITRFGEILATGVITGFVVIISQEIYTFFKKIRRKALKSIKELSHNGNNNTIKKICVHEKDN